MGCFNKFVLFVLNFVVFLVGAAVVVVASLTIHKGNEFGALLSGGIVTLPIIILLAGLAILLIGFLGCCGAMKENSCMLKTYALVVLVLVIAQITLGILIFVYRGEAEEIFTDSMKSAMVKYGTGDEALDNSIDAACHEIQCCGVSNFTDWQTINSTYNGVADGCCKEQVKGCGEDYFTSSSKPDIWQTGCYTKAQEAIGGYDIWLGVLAIALAIIQLICVSCACGIANKGSEYV